VRLGVLDVGSNTLRLLVAVPTSRGLQVVGQEKTPLGLGADIEEHGYVTEPKVQALVTAVTKHRRSAQKLRCEALSVLVASPGRQAANSADIVAALERTAGAPVRVLSAEEEGLLAYEGAVATLDHAEGVIGVVDVGGGSTQLVVGHSVSGPAWARSVDLGSLRLARRLLAEDAPSREAIRRARLEAARSFAPLVPPLPRTALAVGGTARNLQRVVGPVLGAEELEEALDLLAGTRAKTIVKRYGVSPERARTLTAGAVILAEVHRRFLVDLRVARAGLREGALFALAREAAAA
jgi:exopolyphosphatase/guanosine-5'-triphosphate,3'-diphosphate pyrophosphatase